jgi:two-component system chemotaxis sensor kinase CheA
MAVNISEYQQLFLSEARELTNSANNVLVNLEKDPANSALLQELFRQSHTLKSIAQSMGYVQIVKLTHSVETTLALLRKGELKAEKTTINLLFQALDTLSNLIDETPNGKGKKAQVARLLKRFDEAASAVIKEHKKPANESEAKLKLDKIEPGEIEARQTHEIISSFSSGEAQTVRVPLTRLDNIMDVVGELAINHIRLSRIAQTLENPPLEETVAQISRLSSQLQEQMMQVRLVPLGYIFAPYSRLVRDLAVNQKKEVDFLIEGSHIGLDRSIQDEINEPLLHLIKNAVIHGIEAPEERERLKKARRGNVKLTARRERNFVVVELSDDGRGMDIDEVKNVALEKGIVTAEALSSLTPAEIIMLTTYPGYSNAKNITEAAGRGVGLNASRLKVESLGGTLNIDTLPDEGTVFSIKLPLTMAIVQVLLVGISEETYCIPLSHITETIKVSPREVRTIERHEIITYRDTVLPLVRLREKSGLLPSASHQATLDISTRIPTIPVVVVGEGSQRVGLVVDSLLGQQEAVIKPLTGILKKSRGISGATILSTGRVAPILDISPLL